MVPGDDMHGDRQPPLRRAPDFARITSLLACGHDHAPDALKRVAMAGAGSQSSFIDFSVASAFER